MQLFERILALRGQNFFTEKRRRLCVHHAALRLVARLMEATHERAPLATLATANEPCAEVSERTGGRPGLGCAHPTLTGRASATMFC